MIMRVLLTGGTGMVGRNIRNHRIAQTHCLLTPSRNELDLTNRQQIKSYFSLVLMPNNRTQKNLIYFQVTLFLLYQK